MSAAVVAVLLVLSSCGGGGEEGQISAGKSTSVTTNVPESSLTTIESNGSATTIPSTGPGATTGTTSRRTGGGSATTTPSAGTSPGESPLQRRDAPPSGIRSQFEFFQVGNGFCRGLPPGPPRGLVEEEAVEIGEFFAICFPGFELHQPLDAEVLLPNGVVRRSHVTFIDPDGVAYWPWHALPGDPIGRYVVSATQNTLKGTGSFTVGRASRPGILVAPPESGPPGTTFRIGIFGFDPNEEVQVYVYRDDRDDESSGVWNFVTTLVVPVDSEGQTLYTLTTRAGDPRGTYCFLHRGPKAAPTYGCGGLANIYLG